MQVVRLPFGERAPTDADCISIGLLPSGQARLQGSILADEESVAIIGGDPYRSVSDAEAAGLAWATEQGIEQIYIAVCDEEGGQTFP